MRSLLFAAALVTCSGHTEKKMEVVVTAYCPCTLCTDGDGVTATGRSAYLPGVAVDPAIIPLGSRLDVPGYGSWMIADDTGGKIKGRRIDIRLKSHSEAQVWGKKRMVIRVWEKK